MDRTSAPNEEFLLAYQSFLRTENPVSRPPSTQSSYTMASYDSSEMHGLPLLPNVTHPHGTVAFSTQTTPPAYGWTDSLVLTTPWHGHVAQPVTMPQYSYEAVFNAPVSWSQAPSAVRTVPSQQYDMQPQPGYQPQEVSSAPAGPSAYGRQTLFPQGQGDVLTNPFPRSRSSRAQMTTPARESSIGLTTARGKRIASSPILRSSGPRVFREQGPARSEPAEQQGEGEQNDDEDDEDEEEGDEEGEDGSPSDQLGPESEAEDGSDDGEDASENESEDESTNESANESEAVLSGDGGARGAELGHTPDQQEAFAQLARVRRRANVTTEENAEYMCFCGKQFRRQYNFRTHLQTHDPSRLYAHPCPYENCDKKFTRKSDLLRHENSVHIRHKKFSCPRCPLTFARRDTLRRHYEDQCLLRAEPRVQRSGESTPGSSTRSSKRRRTSRQQSTAAPESNEAERSPQAGGD